MSQPTPQPDALTPADAELLELYLDGQLSGERAAQAEARIAEVPAMQEAVAQQERIDGSLKKQFHPPAVDQAFLQQLLAGGSVTDADDSAKVTPRSIESSDRLHQRRMQLLALAATLAAVTVWGTLGVDSLQQLWRGQGGYALLTVGEVYQEAIQEGFEPDWLCEDDQQFAQTFADRQGQGLLLEPLPEGVRMAGLAYREGLTVKSTSMYAYADGEPVLLIVGRTELIKPSLLNADGNRKLTVFKKQLGDLTLVEVTPLGESRVLESLVLAEVPAAPTGHVPGAPRG